jgi:hypothetical protein
VPIIRSIQVLSDRIIVETPRGTREFVFSDVGQAVINQGAAAIEAFVLTRLDDPARDFAVSPVGRNFFMAVHVVTLSPLTLTTKISNTPISGEWWRAD